MTQAWRALTPREAEVLAAVGRRLGNAEIAAEHHVSVRTVESHIAALRRKLGVDTRAGLVRVAAEHRAAAMATPADSFVGRDRDLAAVRDLLARCRRVTVVGPAGCGKSRLARELAAAGPLVPVLVGLEHAGDSDVPVLVAKALGVGHDGSTDPVRATAVALGGRDHLLVLDDCDRAAGGVEELVRALLPLVGGLRVLATCRSPLGGPEEALVELAPLPVEGPGRSPAAQLFLDRSGSIGADLQARLDADGTAAELVDRVCRRLDGLPLALELAAARMRHLSLAELADQLDQLDQGLAALDRSGPVSRHRTLEAALDWTWDLLDDEERSVLTRLAALPRTFDLPLAGAVAGPEVTRVVYRLLDRSLVTRAAQEHRFRLLEPIRVSVLRRAPEPVVTQVRRRHLQHHVELADRLRERARTDDSPAAVAHAHLLCPEVNAAVDWALAHDPAAALPLVHALAVGGEQYGPDVESLTSITRAARHPAVRAAASPQQLLDLGVALCYGDLDLVGELAETALAGAVDVPARLAAHHLAGYADAYRHRGEAALAHVDTARALALRLGETWQLASVEQCRGIALRGLGRLEQAIAAFATAGRLFAEAGDALHVNNTRYMRASTAAEAGHDPQEVRAWADECVAYAREVGHAHELAHALLTRALVAPGDDGLPDLVEARDGFRRFGDLRCLTRSLLALARLAPPEDAVPLLLEALAVARQAHDPDHQATVLERLVAACWATGEHRRAAVALGELAGVVGAGPAVDRAPRALVEDLPRWESAMAEGRSRVPAPLSAPAPR